MQDKEPLRDCSHADWWFRGTYGGLSYPQCGSRDNQGGGQPCRECQPCECFADKKVEVRVVFAVAQGDVEPVISGKHGRGSIG